ncbi:cytochrome c peroxidase [Perkinsela sp. CCAP 1560/4]|nr:cytochrome c peroxidase [Perkinsela sp. CCAP 1560/4]|eukprot:KNH06409.1 cytochrome c peroxidase [Perkinsela sp. CCAP 1560/4]
MALPYALAVTTGFLTIHYIRRADLTPVLGTWGHHEERKRAIRIKEFLTASLENDKNLCAVLCEVALWYVLVSPTCRLDSFLFEFVDGGGCADMPLSGRLREGIRQLKSLVEVVERAVSEQAVRSQSDIIHMIVCTALECIGGPRLKSKIGRRDHSLTDDSQRAQLVEAFRASYGKKQSVESLGDWFSTDLRTLRKWYFALCSREQDLHIRQYMHSTGQRQLIRQIWADQYLLALYGGFRALHPEIIVPGGDKQFLVFSNHFFTALAGHTQQVTAEAGTASTSSQGGISALWHACVRRYRAYLGDPKGLTSVDRSFCLLDANFLRDPLTSDWVSIYAADEDYFFKSFACAFAWLLDRGFSSSALVDVYYKG